jgi:hypothetical protein
VGKELLDLSQFDGHTHGPWLWNVSLKSRSAQLEAQIRSFETVMDFVRWGTGSAAPRFRKGDGDHVLMTRVEEFAVPVPGREHHESWYRTIDSPDARLMAAAPELLKENRELRAALSGLDPEAVAEVIAACEEPPDSEMFSMIDAFMEAKADGDYARSLRDQLAAWNHRLRDALAKLRRT